MECLSQKLGTVIYPISQGRGLQGHIAMENEQGSIEVLKMQDPSQVRIPAVHLKTVPEGNTTLSPDTKSRHVGMKGKKF